MDHSVKGQNSEAQAYHNFVESVKDNVPDDLNLLDRVIPLKDCKVIDLGCGTGQYTYRLAERVGPNGTVLGVDPDRERIEIAREKCEKDNLTFVVGDGERYPEGQYDLIFSNYVIHRIEDKQPTFERAYKNLRPGGQFAIVVVKGIEAVTDELTALLGPDGYKAVYSQWHHCSTNVYEKLAVNAGFEVTFSEDSYDPLTFPNVDTFVSSWCGITNGVFDPSKADKEGLKKFKEKYGKKPMEVKCPVLRFIFTKTNN